MSFLRIKDLLCNIDYLSLAKYPAKINNNKYFFDNNALFTLSGKLGLAKSSGKCYNIPCPVTSGAVKYGALAQLVARYIRIVEVTGSNPVCSTKTDTSEPFGSDVSFYAY